MEKRFEHFEIAQDNDAEKHRPASEEQAFCLEVAKGNLDAVKKNCEAHRFISSDGVGVLSRDPLTNIKYHLVVSCAIITRVCIHAGMIEEQGFRMSDYYIQQLDGVSTIAGVEKIHDAMVTDFATKMRMNAGLGSCSERAQLYIHS